MKFKFKKLLMFSALVAPVVVSSCSNNPGNGGSSDEKMGKEKQKTPPVNPTPSPGTNPSPGTTPVVKKEQQKVYTANDQKTKISVVKNELKLEKKFDNSSIEALKNISKESKKPFLFLANSNLTKESFLNLISSNKEENLQAQNLNSVVVSENEIPFILLLDNDFSNLLNLVKITDKTWTKQNSIKEKKDQFYKNNLVDNQMEDFEYTFTIKKMKIDEQAKKISFNLSLSLVNSSFNEKWSADLSTFTFIDAF
ncbi:hypothetical protein [Mycoplasma sp. E35C]|uniref:hypothetical protein n=1 Tax=Mycoplasma sp. E35C TaxID=2801918 RepID=UPI001CA448AC|nr:hypothetical protein [Mycoplasma sp. E35C]QZX49430.1 hypothetical protein JJE79_01640 [Mycoplasma sp. E35C]